MNANAEQFFYTSFIPSTANIKPQTVNHKPQTINHKPQTTNPQTIQTGVINRIAWQEAVSVS
jgi:hypothetical protein